MTPTPTSPPTPDDERDLDELADELNEQTATPDDDLEPLGSSPNGDQAP